MKFIEKYWWVLLILVIVAVVLYLYFSKEATTTTTTTTTSPCAASNFATKITAVESEIDATPAWKTQIEGKLTQADHQCFGKTYAQCRKLEAIYVLKDQGIIPSSCTALV